MRTVMRLAQFFMGDIATPFIVYSMLIQTQTQLEYYRQPPLRLSLDPPFLGSCPTTNSHHSPPALIGNLASQSVVTVTANSLSNSISILATTSSNSTFELHQRFDVFDCLF
ncbi:hypothetical protein O181_053761 [Austropuccinia psidii MF-1]|uniref:Uncharacterized protein n=1 Tax=Austropuccinia psidii MF-1 TaxID=1389203 RepID=A0A9Q3HQH2_9BASI|nr:hypothetical protein [Austropuccinia psidii MF-1]